MREKIANDATTQCSTKMRSVLINVRATRTDKVQRKNNLHVEKVTKLTCIQEFIHALNRRMETKILHSPSIHNVALLPVV